MKLQNLGRRNLHEVGSSESIPGPSPPETRKLLLEGLGTVSDVDGTNQWWMKSSGEDSTSSSVLNKTLIPNLQLLSHLYERLSPGTL